MRIHNKHAVHVALVALSGIIATACTTVQPPPVQQAPSVLPPVAKGRPVVPVPAFAPSFKSKEQYEKVLAQRIYDANRGSTVTGKLQPLLRAVVVLQFDVDASGNVHNVRTWRSPEREADHIARTSLHRAEALPPPPASWLHNGRVEVTETFLFNKDGRFHLRALSPHQD